MNQSWLPAFPVNSTQLTSAQKASIFTRVAEYSSADKYICTGVTSPKASSKERLKIRIRAKAACEYAATLNPYLSTWFQSKNSNAKRYQGRVLISIKTPLLNQDSEAVSRSSFESPDTVAGFQIKPIYLLPSDVADERLDLNGTIATSLREGNDFLKKTIGLEFPLDMNQQGEIDIGFIQSSMSTNDIEQLLSEGGRLDGLIAGTGFEKPSTSRKLYVLFAPVKDSADVCGRGVVSGTISLVAMKGSCGASSSEFGRVFSKVWIHEALHNLGVEHVPENCDLMSSRSDFPETRCFSNQRTEMDPNGIYYLGSNAAGVDILTQKAWVGNNLLSDQDRGTCKPLFDQNGRSVKGTWICSIGLVVLGPRDFCWSQISSSKMQTWSGGKWTTLGNGIPTKLPWGSKDVWECKSGGVAPSLKIRVAKADENWYRWQVNGKTLDPFRVIFQN